MKTKKERKGMLSHRALGIMLVIAVCILTVLIIYTFTRYNDYEALTPGVIVLDNGFRINNVIYDSKNISFSILRIGGLEDYQGFQVFLEDSYGKVKAEDVYVTLNVGEKKLISVNHNKKLSNVKYATLIPIY